MHRIFPQLFRHLSHDAIQRGRGSVWQRETGSGTGTSRQSETKRMQPRDKQTQTVRGGGKHTEWPERSGLSLGGLMGQRTVLPL